ncbi:hypothetical protein D3C81_996000 [compost metagenome]
MVDVVEEPFDVCVQNPTGGSLFGKTQEELRHRIRRTTFDPEAVAIRIAMGFGDGRQGQHVQRLHSPIRHGRYAQWAFPSIRLRDVDSP